MTTRQLSWQWTHSSCAPGILCDHLGRLQRIERLKRHANNTWKLIVVGIVCVHFRSLFKRFVFFSHSLSYIWIVQPRVLEILSSSAKSSFRSWELSKTRKSNKIRRWRKLAEKKRREREIVDLDSEQVVSLSLSLSLSLYLRREINRDREVEKELENSFSRHLSRLSFYSFNLPTFLRANCILFASWGRKIRISRWLLLFCPPLSSSSSSFYFSLYFDSTLFLVLLLVSSFLFQYNQKSSKKLSGTLYGQLNLRHTKFKSSYFFIFHRKRQTGNGGVFVQTLLACLEHLSFLKSFLAHYLSTFLNFYKKKLTKSSKILQPPCCCCCFGTSKLG